MGSKLRKLIEEAKKDSVDAKTMKQDIEELLTTRQKLDDTDVHAFAADRGYDKHEVEEVIYGYAKRFVKFMGEGLSAKATPEQIEAFDKGEVAKGKKVEQEHTSDDEIAERIMRDHLYENGAYYTMLAAMEAEAKKAEKEKK